MKSRDIDLEGESQVLATNDSTLRYAATTNHKKERSVKDVHKGPSEILDSRPTISPKSLYLHDCPRNRV